MTLLLIAWPSLLCGAVIFMITGIVTFGRVRDWITAMLLQLAAVSSVSSVVLFLIWLGMLLARPHAWHF
jgi:hypothetical protein